jgi:Tol biopolymer transport system component/DNA-binding winged helix-turn-helix (wHTH) protein
MREQTRPSYEFGPFRLDPAEHLLLRDGQAIPLTPKNFEVLRALVENAGHLMTRDRLLQEVWPGTFVEDAVLSRSVFVLRRALGDDPDACRYIETVPKRGYRFVARVVAVGPNGIPTLPVEAGSALSGPAPADPFAATSPSATDHHHGRRDWLRMAFAGGLLAAGVVAYVLGGSTGSDATVTARLAPAYSPVTFTGREAAPALSPDGSLIAYVSTDSAARRLMVRDLHGSLEPRQAMTLFSTAEIGHLRWSPDGSELLFWARGPEQDGVYTLPSGGGTPRLVAARRYVACWSPDGSTIATGNHLDGTIWLMNRLERTERTILLEGVHWSIWDLDWSAATNRLVFVSSNSKGRYTVGTIGPDGRGQRHVIAEDREIFSARWAPDGNSVYYLRRMNQTDTLGKVAVTPGGVTAMETLLSGLETDRVFDVSRDGRRLAYIRAPFYSNLWTVDVPEDGNSDAIATSQLTTGTSLIERPRVSPDGRSVLFNVGREPRTDVYTMPIAGGLPKRLTFLEAVNVAGGWSADGTQVAFASTQGGRGRVWVIDGGGGAPRAVSSAALSDTLDVTWSPGPRILFQQAGNRNYHELNADGGDEGLLAGKDPPGWLFSPAYSPDGQRVAVMWNRRPNRGIWTIELADRAATPIYETEAGASWPIGWSADGRHVYVLEGMNAAYRSSVLPFVGETMTHAKILKVPVGGGPVRTVVSLPFDEIGSASMTPDGRRFVVTVYSSSSDVWIVDDFDNRATPAPPSLALP